MTAVATRIAASLAARRLRRAEQIQAVFEDHRRRALRPAHINPQFV
jgi:hypothetical protein